MQTPATELPGADPALGSDRGEHAPGPEGAAPAPRHRRPGRTPARLAAGLVLAAVAVVVWVALSDEPERRPAPPVAVADPRLSWSPPALEEPETIVISDESPEPELEPGEDYVLVMPEPLTVGGGLVVKGGRNVVLIGGEIVAPDEERGPESRDRRGLFLTEQTGTVHIEGLLIRGDDLAEGINIDERDGAVVQLQNIRVERVHGREKGHHADVIQTWAGPSELRVDRLTGYTNYQGFFLLPNQRADVGSGLAFDLRRVDLHGDEDAGYLLWQSEDDELVLNLQDVYVDPADQEERRRFLQPDELWGAARTGTPPGGEFVPAGSVGVHYTSPGYVT